MDMLFSPTKIQGLTLKNRVVALPVFTGYALPDSRVSQLMLEHYQRLAGSGASVVVIPNVAVAENGRTSDRSLLLNHDEHIDGLRRLVGVIKEHNAVACIQLNHGGRYAISDHPFLPSAIDPAEAAKNISTLKNFMESFPFAKRFGLTAHVAKMTSGWTREMTDTDIHETIAAFGESAYRASQAGFDMIELHGATGYLIAQFLSARTNRRPPPWGGSPDARMRFPLKIIDEIKSRLPNTPVGFRLILDEKAENGISTQEAIAFASKLEQHGCAYLSATVGTYQSMFMPDVAKQLSRPGYLASLTRYLREHVNIPVIISGRVVSPKLAEKTLQNGEADLVGLGRPLLADPEWINKAKSNNQIVGCKNCNTCFQNVAIGESVICDRWPKVVQDRIKLETRFTSRHGYRTLIVLSSISDLKIAKNHIRNRVPVHTDIIDRQLFLDKGEEDGFSDAAREYASWCDQYLHTYLKRDIFDNLFVDETKDPVNVVMEHLKDNFGFISIIHDETSQWKKQLVLKVPADVVVLRGGTHPDIKKVLIPCDLSTFTLMQIRVALHVIHGRSDVNFRFVHVTRSPKQAADKWVGILENFEMDPSTDLKILQPDSESTVAEMLLNEVKTGGYGSLIIGRCGGLARARRRIFGSVSERLLKELPECTFAIVG